jgi:hypothetical protein
MTCGMCCCLFCWPCVFIYEGMCAGIIMLTTLSTGMVCCRCNFVQAAVLPLKFYACGQTRLIACRCAAVRYWHVHWWQQLLLTPLLVLQCMLHPLPAQHMLC